MNPASVVVQGMIKPDGTLELDEKVSLPAGRVQITIQPAPGPQQGREGWWHNLQRARSVLETRGTGFRSQEEIEAERQDFRSGDKRMDDADRITEEVQRSLDRKEC